MEYLDKIRKFVVENFLFGDETRLQNDTSFLESGIIDSTGILELITFLESTFNTKIQDDELVPENLDSLANLTNFMRRKLDGKLDAAV